MNPLANEPVWSLVAGFGTVVNAGMGLLLILGHDIKPTTVAGVNTFMGIVISWILRARVAPVTGTQDGTTIYPAGSAKQDAQNAKSEKKTNGDT